MTDSPGVYLIHFDRPLAHAQHYLGSAKNISRRVTRHRRGVGARLLRVIGLMDIGWKVVRTWNTHDAQEARRLELLLKHRKNSRKLCPVCTGKGK